MVNKRRGMKETVLSPKEKIIRHLIEHKEPISIRGISRALNMDYKNSHSIINDPNIDIIAKENLGNTYLIELKPTSNQEIYTVEKKRAKQFLSENTKIQTIINIELKWVHVAPFGLMFSPNRSQCIQEAF